MIKTVMKNEILDIPKKILRLIKMVPMTKVEIGILFCRAENIPDISAKSK